jgi:hypothetical protein
MQWYKYLERDGTVVWSAEPPYLMTAVKWTGTTQESDVQPRQEYFDHSGFGQASYNPPKS